MANALVCKTSIRGFDPLPVLHKIISLYLTEKATPQRIPPQLLKLIEDTEYARSKDATFNALLNHYNVAEAPIGHPRTTAQPNSTHGSRVSILRRRLRDTCGA